MIVISEKNPPNENKGRCNVNCSATGFLNIYAKTNTKTSPAVATVVFITPVLYPYIANPTITKIIAISTIFILFTYNNIIIQI